MTLAYAARWLLTTLTMWTLGAGLIALVVNLLTRRASASLRSSIWNIALMASIIGPALSLAGPRLAIHTRVLPRSLAAVTNVAGAAPLAPPPHGPGGEPSFTSQPSVSEILSVSLGALWMLGFALVGLRYFAQVLAARGLIRRSVSCEDARVARLLDKVADRLPYKRFVRVVQTTEIDIPVVTGFLRPTILLPESSAEWSDGQLEMVLIHELAHLERSDTIARMVSMAACALHWFNPAVWAISRRAMKEAEMAADDMVVNMGVRPSTYADALLDLVAGMTARLEIEPVTALLSRSILAARIDRIIHQHTRGRGPGRTGRSILVLGSCGTIAVVACMRVQPAESFPLDTIRLRESSTATQQSIPEIVPIDIRAPVFHAKIGKRAAEVSILRSPDADWVSAAVAGLTTALADPSPNVRGEAARALGQFHARSATPDLQRLLDDPNKFVRAEAADALQAIARSSKGA